MSEQHLLRTLEIFIDRCEKIDIAKDYNPRYISDIEYTFEITSKYYFIACMEGILNPILQQRFESVYDNYKRNRKSVFIPQ